MTTIYNPEKRQRIVGSPIITTPSEAQRQTIDQFLRRRPPKKRLKVQ